MRRMVRFFLSSFEEWVLMGGVCLVVSGDIYDGGEGGDV